MRLSCRIFAGVVIAACLHVGPAGAQSQSAEIDRLNKKVFELYKAQEFEQAIPLARRALEMAERSGPQHGTVAAPLNNLASLYEALGRYGDAEPLRMRVVGAFERSLGPSNPELAVPLAGLAMHYQSTGRYREAEAAYRRALDIRERAGRSNDHYVGHLLERLGSVAELKGQYAEAEELYKRALAAGESAVGPDHLLVGNALSGLAHVYYRIGRHADAEALNKRALPIMQNAWGPNHYTVARILNGLGLVYAAQGRHGDAETYYRRALSMREAIFGHDHYSVAESLNNLGLLYREQRNFAAAEPIIKRDLAIGEKSLGSGHPDVAIALENLAGLYGDQERYAEARSLYERALGIRMEAFGPDNPDVAASLNNLGYIALEQSEWTRAADLFQRSFDTKIRWSRRGGTALERTKDGSTNELQTFIGLIKAAFRVTSRDKARYDEFVGATFSRAQSATGSEAAASLAQMAARLATGEADLARIVRERQDLIGEWRDRDRELIKAAGEQIAQRNIANEERVRARRAAVDARIGEIDKVLSLSFPEYSALTNPAPLSVAEVQAELRSEEALVLVLDTPSWKQTPEETFLWIVTKGEVRWLKSELGTAALQKEVAALRCGLDAAAWDGDGAAHCADLLKPLNGKPPNDGEPLPFDAGRAHKLFVSLFGAARDLIRGKDLLVVPSGALTTLPFHVLVSEPPNPIASATARWLILDHAITMLPSVSSLAALRRTAKPSAAPRPLIGFGNPLLDGNQSDVRLGAHYRKLAQQARDVVQCSPPRTKHLSSLRSAKRAPALVPQTEGLADLAHLRLQVPLPETAAELCAVAHEVGADTGDLRIGTKATETEVKRLSSAGDLVKYRIVHFATHGTLAGQLRGTREPGLILTPPATATAADDGYLSSSEIAALKLDADWVILSACNTAGSAGDGEAAEALSGLARAFFYAGARALLVSHWEVDSAATVKLITTAVGELARDQSIGRAQALRRAISAVIADDTRPSGWVPAAHPMVWAPFVVVGEGGARR